MPLTSLVSPRDVMQMHGNQISDSGTSNHPSNIATSDKLSNEEQLSDTGQKIQPHSRIGESIVDGSCHKDGDLVRTCRELERKCPSDCQHLLFLNGLTDSGVEPSNQLRPSIYRWPNLEKVVDFDAGRLDSKGVLLFYFPDQGKCKQRDGILYLWIGGCFDQHNRNSHQDSSRERGEVKEIDWIQVAGDFLALIGMPKDIPIEVCNADLKFLYKFPLTALFFTLSNSIALSWAGSFIWRSYEIYFYTPRIIYMYVCMVSVINFRQH